jgi:hypothetical protein
VGGAADEGAAECTKRVEALAQAWHTTSKGQDYSNGSFLYFFGGLECVANPLLMSPILYF